MKLVCCLLFFLQTLCIVVTFSNVHTHTHARVVSYECVVGVG